MLNFPVSWRKKKATMGEYESPVNPLCFCVTVYFSSLEPFLRNAVQVLCVASILSVIPLRACHFGNVTINNNNNVTFAWYFIVYTLRTTPAFPLFIMCNKKIVRMKMVNIFIICVCARVCVCPYIFSFSNIISFLQYNV